MLLITNRSIKLSFLGRDEVTIPSGKVMDCEVYLKASRVSYAVIKAPVEYRGYTVIPDSEFLDEMGWIRIPTKRLGQTHGSN